MAVCKTNRYFGKIVPFEFVVACGNQLPPEEDWKRLGGFRSKEMGQDWETVDGTADDTVGNTRSNIATWQNFTLSGDGVCMNDDSEAAQNYLELYHHFTNPDQEEFGGQPVAWFRVTFPDVTITRYMLVTNMGRSMPYDDLVTFNFEAIAAHSVLGTIVEPTLP